MHIEMKFAPTSVPRSDVEGAERNGAGRRWFIVLNLFMDRDALPTEEVKQLGRL